MHLYLISLLLIFGLHNSSIADLAYAVDENKSSFQKMEKIDSLDLVAYVNKINKSDLSKYERKKLENMSSGYSISKKIIALSSLYAADLGVNKKIAPSVINVPPLLKLLHDRGEVYGNSDSAVGMIAIQMLLERSLLFIVKNNKSCKLMGTVITPNPPSPIVKSEKNIARNTSFAYGKISTMRKIILLSLFKKNNFFLNVPTFNQGKANSSEIITWLKVIKKRNNILSYPNLLEKSKKIELAFSPGAVYAIRCGSGALNLLFDGLQDDDAIISIASGQRAVGNLNKSNDFWRISISGRKNNIDSNLMQHYFMLMATIHPREMLAQSSAVPSELYRNAIIKAAKSAINYDVNAHLNNMA